MRKPTNVRGIYHVGVMYRKVDYRRSSGTKNERAAILLQAEIEERLKEFKKGRISLQEGVSIGDFLLYGMTMRDEKEREPKLILELVDEYERSIGPPAISESYLKTKLTYLKHFRRFIEKEGKKLPASLDAWTQICIESYRSWRFTNAGRCAGYPVPRPLTVSREVRELGCMFDLAVKRGWVDKNPARDLDRIPDTPPKEIYRTLSEVTELLKQGLLSDEDKKVALRCMVFSLDEVDEIIELLWNKADSIYVDRKGDVAMILELCGQTGMRIGEALKLTRMDVSLDVSQKIGDVTTWSKKQCRAVRETPRCAPLPPSTVLRLADWLSVSSGPLVFGERATEKAFVDKLYRQLDKAFCGTKFLKVRPHQLRHSCKTNLHDCGVDEKASELMLGHTTKEMGDRYRHIALKRLRSEMEKVWNRHSKGVLAPVT